MSISHTHLLVKLNGILEEGWMVNKIKVAPVFRYLTQVHINFTGCARQEWFGVPQTVHHGHKLLIEILVRCPTYVKGVLQFNKIKYISRQQALWNCTIWHMWDMLAVTGYLADCTRGMHKCQMNELHIFSLNISVKLQNTKLTTIVGHTLILITSFFCSCFFAKARFVRYLRKRVMMFRRVTF